MHPNGDGLVPPNEVDTYRSRLGKMAEKWLLIKLTHQVSASATNAFWKAALDYIPELIKSKERDSVARPIPGFIHLRRLMYKGKCPTVQMKFAFLNRTTDQIEIVHCQTNPGRMYNRAKFVKLYEEAHVKVNPTTFVFNINALYICCFYLPYRPIYSYRPIY